MARRKEETAKTLSQIHKDVAKEEARAKRSSSVTNLKLLGDRAQRRSSALPRDNQPKTDDDGFVVVSGKGAFKRSFSANNLRRSISEPTHSSEPSKSFTVLKEERTHKRQ